VTFETALLQQLAYALAKSSICLLSLLIEKSRLKFHLYCICCKLIQCNKKNSRISL